MSDLAYVKLSDGDVTRRLGELQDWQLENGQIVKTFKFATYKDGAVFTSAIAYVADKLNHHPDITLGYAKVKVAVNTHDVGGLSPYDFELAKRIEALD